MHSVLPILLSAILLSACANDSRPEKKLSIGEVRCLLKDCRQFSTEVLGRATEVVGATFEIVDPKEFSGKRVALFAGYDALHGHELLLVPLGTKIDVDLGKADVIMLHDGTLKARSPYDFTFKKVPNQPPEPTSGLRPAAAHL